MPKFSNFYINDDLFSLTSIVINDNPSGIWTLQVVLPWIPENGFLSFALAEAWADKIQRSHSVLIIDDN